MAMTSETAPATQRPSMSNGDAETLVNEAKRQLDAPMRATTDARFHIFVIDTGWNCAASKVLHDHIDILSHLNIDDKLFVLDRAMSLALLRHYPLQVGRDPIIAVHDLRPHHRHRIKHTHGFRMHLGILDDEHQVLNALKMFARFLVTHRNAADIDQLVREDLHRKGLTGAIQILGGHEAHKLVD
jgi:hypothetical protein